MTAPVLPEHPPHPASKSWSDAEMARIADIARDSAGLVFSSNRIPSAEQGIRRAMRTLGLSDLKKFGDAAEEPGPAREALLAELTIGESYFFREPAQLEFVARELLPAFAAERKESATPAPLKFWSAGCANGEEPYSLAMLLSESSWAYGSEILGSDVSVPRLVSAKRGRYSEWAMRATPRPLVSRYFEQNGKQYLLRKEIRAMVQFRAVNLVSDPSLPAHGLSGMDVIFCRNVLIYFSMETVARVAERLLASLSPGGWLLISSSDPPLNELVRCETVTTTAGLAYRRDDRPGRSIPQAAAPLTGWTSGSEPLVPANDWTLGIEPPPVRRREPAPAHAPAIVPTPAPVPDPVVATVEVAYAAGDFDRAAALAEARLAAGHDDERTRVVHVRALANRGRLDDAGAACAAALDQFPLSPELHLLHATLLARAGHFAETAVAARRVLYLDPEMVMAQIIAAEAMTRLGDARGAARALRLAAATLAELPAEEHVRAADGETAGRLRQLVAFHLKALADEGGR